MAAGGGGEKQGLLLCPGAYKTLVAGESNGQDPTSAGAEGD